MDKSVVKVFAGVLITSELRMHLHESELWKNESILNDPERLAINSFEGKEYMGRFLESRISRKNLEILDKAIKSKIEAYCPNFQAEKLSTSLFSQFLIG